MGAVLMGAPLLWVLPVPWATRAAGPAMALLAVVAARRIGPLRSSRPRRRDAGGRDGSGRHPSGQATP
jgi:hypothetical protein